MHLTGESGSPAPSRSQPLKRSGDSRICADSEFDLRAILARGDFPFLPSSRPHEGIFPKSGLPLPPEVAKHEGMPLPLAAAVRLGSLLVAHPAPDTRSCALGMALLANGITPSGDTENDLEAAMRLYRWIAQGGECPWCGQWMPYEAMIYHPFDEHVMDGLLTMEAFCDWIGEIEPLPYIEESEAVEARLLARMKAASD